MTALPASSDFTGPVTEGQFKTAITAQRDFQAGLLGTDGTVATALATLGAIASFYVAKTSAYTVTTADRGKVIDATTGTWTLTLPAAASAGAGFSVAARNSGAGTITVDGNASELVDGATTVAVTGGTGVLLVCTGSAWIAHWMSSPTSAAMGLKANLASPSFTGNLSAAGPVLLSNGSAAAPSMAFTNSATTGLFRASAGTIGVSFSGSEMARLTSTVWRIGSPTASLMGGSRIEVAGTSITAASIGQFAAIASSSGPRHILAKSRGTTVTDFTIVNSGDNLGVLSFQGADGTALVNAGATIRAVVAGTPASGDVRAEVRVATGSAAATVTDALLVDINQRVLAISTGGLGYGTGAGGTVTQGTSRTTGVTLNRPSGAITMFTAAGSATPASFVVTNSAVAATDVIILNVKSGATNIYNLAITAVGAGSFTVTFWTTGGTASDTPVINFAVIKSVTS